MRELLADILKIIHRIIVIFVVIGCTLPKKFLIYHIILFPGLLIHWKTNNNYCILTQIENNLRNKKTTKTVNEDHDQAVSFMKPFFKDIFNIDLDIETCDKLTIVMFTISWLISFIRYFSK